MNLTLQEYNALIEAGLGIVAILFPTMTAYVAIARRIKAEMMVLLNELPMANRDIRDVAQNKGLSRAAWEMDKLISREDPEA